MDTNDSSYTQLPDVLNATQLANTLGISRAGAYNLLDRKGFPTLRIGKRKLVPKKHLITWIESQIEQNEH